MALCRVNRPLAWNLIAVCCLLTGAATFRLPDLGVLGFYGDEETTAFASVAVAEGRGFRMPSGLSYYRAMPLTALNAMTAEYLGTDSEISYRLPAALFGVLTPVALFMLARLLVPAPIAFTAAMFLVFSEWHILTSREARMYAPFMLFFLTSGLMIWRWAPQLNFSRLLVLSGAVAITLSFHALGVLLVLFPAVWLALRKRNSDAWKGLAIISVVVVVLYLFLHRFFVMPAFSEWAHSVGTALKVKSEITRGAGLAMVKDPSSATALLGAIGALVGGCLGWRIISHEDDFVSWANKAAVMIVGIIFGACWCAAQYYAAGLAAASLLLLRPLNDRQMLLQVFWPIIALAIIGTGHFVYLYAETGSFQQMKPHFLFPYPYFIYFWDYSPGLVILFWGGVAGLIFGGRNQHENLRASALVTIGIIAGIGWASKWGGMRYLIGAYPFMLLVASYPLYSVYRGCRKHSLIAGNISAVLMAGMVLGGVLKGYGMSSAVHTRQLSYGAPAHEVTLGFPFYPDHQGAGQFVKARLEDQDIVVAVDALQQYWYVGRVDYWLKDAISNTSFMYRDRQGQLRNIYVNSIVLQRPETELALVCSDMNSSIWVITSGEAAQHPEFYLSDEQRAWLKNLAAGIEPAFTGRDGVTVVFHLPCE